MLLKNIRRLERPGFLFSIEINAKNKITNAGVFFLGERDFDPSSISHEKSIIIREEKQDANDQSNDALSRPKKIQSVYIQIHQKQDRRRRTDETLRLIGQFRNIFVDHIIDSRIHHRTLNKRNEWISIRRQKPTLSSVTSTENASS